MANFTVRHLTEDEWETYKQVRLAALQESPESFVSTYDEEVNFPDERWKERMTRSARLLAQDPENDAAVGVASIHEGSQEHATTADLFGLWVNPQRRGAGAAASLVRAAQQVAREHGMTHLTYWVGTDNGRAVAFASSFGFRPTDNRRPMRVRSAADGDEEIEMVLALGEDRA